MDRRIGLAALQTISGQWKRLQHRQIENDFCWAKSTDSSKWFEQHSIWFWLNLISTVSDHFLSLQEAILEAKGRPSSAGTLFNPNGLAPKRKYIAQHVTTTTTTVAPPLIHDSAFYVTPAVDGKRVPAVYIRPHSEPVDVHSYIPPTVPSSTPSPLYIPSSPQDTYLPATTPSSLFRRPIVVPAQDNLPPLEDPLQPIAVYEPSSTPATPTFDYGRPIAIYNNQPISHLTRFNVVSSTPAPNYPTPTLAGETIEQINNELEPPRFYPSRGGIQIPSSTFAPDYSPISSTTPRPANDYGGQLPLFNRNRYFNKPLSIYQPQRYGDYSSNGLGDGYTPQFPYYDGVSATANGFRYFLPRQYHEENNLDPQRRDGSFGYIDPFGIRRVTYYNTSPEKGFDIRKNNRYVGFNATPYDPRPLQ